MNQLEFFIHQINDYLRLKHKTQVGVRRLHYFITKRPEAEKQIPSSHGKYRTYRNTSYESKNCSKQITKARMSGLIDPNVIIDEKNPELTGFVERVKVEVLEYIYTSARSGNVFIATNDFIEWNKFKESITVESEIRKERFYNQTHRITVIIEKATAKRALRWLCMQYGADLLICGGHLSTTRLYDIIGRAKEEEKPVMILYITDLDVAGWDMPSIAYKKLMEIYPNQNNKVLRITLTREQAIKYDLPPSFDPDTDKKYKEGHKERFYTETGGKECIELDALDEDVLTELLETELKKHSGIDDDKSHTAELKEETKKRINETLEQVKKNKLNDEKERYEHIKEEFKSIIEEVEEFEKHINEEYKPLENELQSIKDSIEDKLRGCEVPT